MKRMQSRGVRFAALGLAAAFALGLAAAPAYAGGRAARGAGADGMQVAIDANGKLRQPTAAEARALAAPMAQWMTKSATSGLQITAWADGTLSAVLTPDYLNVWMVQLNADGSVGQICVDGYEADTAQPAGAPAFEEK